MTGVTGEVSLTTAIFAGCRGTSPSPLRGYKAHSAAGNTEETGHPGVTRRASAPRNDKVSRRETAPPEKRLI